MTSMKKWTEMSPNRQSNESNAQKKKKKPWLLRKLAN
jgi:hypothetical protein